jgi:hypothetical protein
MIALPYTACPMAESGSASRRPDHAPPGCSRKSLARAACALLLLLCAGIGGCGFSPPLSPADRATLDTCRGNADRVYNAQNRAQLSQRDSRDSPFSGSGQAGSPSDGLADQYSHENMVDDCVRHGAMEPGDSPAPK